MQSAKRSWLGQAAVGVAVLAVAVAVRAHRLSFSGLSSDEAFSWRLAQYGWSEIVRRAAADVHPPLYFLLLKAWLGIWGTSAVSLRGLSVVLGLATVAVVYWLCRSALPRRAHEAGLVGGLLLALHADQVLASRNARMYALGTLLAALGAYFLWRALASTGRPSLLWWAAHGGATAAFCYTHYYAFFGALAQAVVVLWVVIARLRKEAWRQAAQPLAGLLLSSAVGFVLYAPWIPVLVGQLREVREHYWIQPLSAPSLVRALAAWSSGMPGSALLLGPVLLAVGWVAWRVGQPAVFFLLQAGIPWLASLSLSALSGRPILLERYLVFSQIFLLALWGVAFGSLERRWERAVLLLLLLPMVVYGLGQAVARYPASASATEQAVASLVRHDLAQDLVVTTSPRALNRYRFYAAVVGVHADSKCILSRSASGDERFSHIASIEERDVVWDDQVPQLSARRLWRVDPRDESTLEGWTLVSTRIFDGGDGSRVLLARFARSR